MVIPSSLPHPVDVEVGRYRAGSQHGARQKEGEERQLHDVAGCRKPPIRGTVVEFGLLVVVPRDQKLC